MRWGVLKFGEIFKSPKIEAPGLPCQTRTLHKEALIEIVVLTFAMAECTETLVLLNITAFLLIQMVWRTWRKAANKIFSTGDKEQHWIRAIGEEKSSWIQITSSSHNQIALAKGQSKKRWAVQSKELKHKTQIETTIQPQQRSWSSVGIRSWTWMILHPIKEIEGGTKLHQILEA